MAFSINSVLEELGVTVENPTFAPPAPAENGNADTLMEPEKVAEFLDALASPDSLVDELAKLAVLQDWVAANNINENDLLNCSVDFQEDEKASMLKRASASVRQMQARIEELEARETRRGEAVKIAKKMYSAGHISRDAILDKVAELIDQPAEELKALDRALDLNSSGKTAAFGSLSDQSTGGEGSFLDYILS